jgi:hypothetical protein
LTIRDTLKDVFVIVFLMIVGIIIGWAVFMKGCGGIVDPNTKTVIKIDTLVVERYLGLVSKDTAIKWYEKLIKINLPPDTIYWEHITKSKDTVFVKESNSLDMMMRVERTGTKFSAFTFNRSDSTAKEYVYNTDWDDFTLISQKNNLAFMERKDIFRWKGLNVGIGGDVSLGQQGGYYLELATGVSILKNFNIEGYLKSYHGGNVGIKAYYNVKF